MTFIATFEGALNALSAMQATVDGMRIRLFTAPTTLSDANVIGDFTEASFSGYAAVHPTWSAAALNASNRAHCDASAAVFTYTGVSGSQTVYGYYLTDSTGAVLYGAELFPTPLPMSPSLPTLTLNVGYTHYPEA